MSYIKNQLIQCRECGFEITPGDGILLYKDPKTWDLLGWTMLTYTLRIRSPMTITLDML